jgi:hypothetical protein
VVERRYKIINWRSWVHGLTAAFLADKPLFGDVASGVLKRFPTDLNRGDSQRNEDERVFAH